MQTTPLIEDEIPTVKSPKPRRRIALLGILVLLVLLGIGITPRLIRSAEAGEVANAAASNVPIVSTAKARLGPPTSELKLPANIEAGYVAAVYARTSGYVKQRLVDIGTPVKAGQLLAEIESPEVDQELAQTRAALGQARAAYEQELAKLTQSKANLNQARANQDRANANRDIAAATNNRWSRLVGRGVLSRQDGDEKRAMFEAREAEVAAARADVETAEATVVAQQANIGAAKANVAAAQANVRRMEQMVSFERVTAPFDGVITQRKIERGDLVTAGSGSAQSSLFTIAQSETLRIQVHVPQTFAPDIQNGSTALIDVQERGGEPVTGRVVRSADALDSRTRTLLTEVQVDNHKGTLLPGMYAEVKFILPRQRPVVVIPADTLIVNGEGTRVAIVDANGKVQFQKVQVGRDLGAEIEVIGGLKGSEQLVSNPSEGLQNGQSVRLTATGDAHERS